MTYTPIYTTANEVYAKSGLTATEVNLTTYDTILEDAELEVEYLTGRKFTNGNTKTEFLNGPKKDVLGISGQKAVSINISEFPIQSITELKILNTDGTTNTTYDTLTTVKITAGTYDSADYWLDTIEDPLTHSIVPYGRIILKNKEFPTGNKNIKVAYTYGYSSVPVAIRNLASCLAGIRAWIRFLGGGYNRLDSYSVPQQTVSKGDFYVRGSKNIQNLNEEANRILDRIGRRPRRLFFASGEDR